MSTWFFFFSSRRRHTRFDCDWSSDVCSSDLGAWAAVGASVITAVVIELLFQITPGEREALEGFTMLLATAVLFYVSYWLVSKIEAAKWSAFVKSRMEEALSAGSGWALASVAFLAVYREGFETILFYKALLTSAGLGGGGGGTTAVL